MFDYPTPKRHILKEMYGSPYNFSDETTAYVMHMFTHPVHNPKYNVMMSKVITIDDCRDMLKGAWRCLRYYEDFPQQFAHSADNVADAMIVNMFKIFMSIHRSARKDIVVDRYLTAPMKMLVIMQEGLIEKLLTDMREGRIVIDRPVHKERKREIAEKDRGRLREGSKHFEYLCSLE